MRARHRSGAADRGSVLPIVLVLVVVFGALAVALATYTATALRTTKVTDNVVNRLAAAESGMQAALEAADGGSCPSSPTSVGTINGATVSTTCVHRSRVENADGAYALVVTGIGVGSNTEFDADGPGRKCIGGPVYFEAGIAVSVGNIAAVSGTDCTLGTAQAGEVRYNVAGGCTASPPAGPGQGAWLEPNPTYSCDARGWAAVAPAPTVPVAQTSLPPLGTPTGTCKVYSQGQQTGGTLNLSNPTFFNSGVYYFNNVTINVTAKVTAGKRIGGSFPVNTTTDHFDSSCQTAWTADPGTGVVFILGGSSTLNVGNGGRLGIYPKDLTVGSGTGAVSVISFNTSTLGYVPSTLDPDSTELISRHNGSTRSASFYGLTYVPRGWVDTGNASSGAYIQFIGGLVAARANVRTEPPVGAFAMYVPSELVDNYLLESTATFDGTSTTVRVVSKVGDTGGLEVVTWRVT